MSWLEDVKYCAEECQRQHSGEMSVYNMASALELARQFVEYKQPLTFVRAAEFIRCLHVQIEPEISHEYRRIPVIIGDKLIPWENIVGQMLKFSKLIVHYVKWNDAVPLITAAELYKEFEEIHPFVDGNGRVGSILYNWLNGTLDKPVAPPDVFNER